MANSHLHIDTPARHDPPVNFAICNEIFDGWTLPDTFAFAKQAGYDAVEITPYTLAPRITDVSPARRAEIRRQAADAGVAISGLHWLLARTEGLYLTHTDATIRELTSNYFVELTRCTSDLGGRFMVLGSPKQRNLLPGVSTEQASQWTLDVLRPAVTLAETLGITLCFEPLAPSETNFINTALEARRLVAGMNSRALQIILDVKAMSSEGRPIPEIIRESKGAFAYFHANDSNLKGPGFGDVDFVPIAAALRDVGYAGCVSVEVFRFEEGPEVIATQSRAYLKRTFGI